MNDSLIKQLELAIQVEKGEVPLIEVERRPIVDLTNGVRHGMKWNPIASDYDPRFWDHENYEYRRKPKPLEKWLMFYSDKSARSFDSLEDAKEAMEQGKNSHFTPVGITHMKEVL